MELVTVLASLVSVVAVSLVSLVGLATLRLDESRIRRLATPLVSFAVGGLLGDAFIHLIPETFATDDRRAAPLLVRSLLVLGGILLFFVVEKLLRHRHMGARVDDGGSNTRDPVLAAVNVLGDGIHNFIDGILIGASYLVSPALGITTTVAVLLHEIPQEIGDFAILIQSGLGVRRAVLVNLASASVAILGTVMALVAGSLARQVVVDLIVPITAGGFVYIAAADLIPELQRDRRVRSLLVQSTMIVLGIGLMGLLTFVE